MVELLQKKRCQTEIDYLLGILPTKEMVINQVEAIILIYLSLKKPTLTIKILEKSIINVKLKIK
jgi:hypothetical protein